MQGFFKSLHRKYSSWQPTTTESLTRELSLLSTQGRIDEALQLLRQIPHSIPSPLHSQTYIPLIHSCIKYKAFKHGKEIHNHLIQNGVQPNLTLHNNILLLYTKSGDLGLARKLFDEMPERNMISWTAVIGGYVNSGDSDKAFGCYNDMKLTGNRADNFVYPLVLKSCARMRDLISGRTVHCDVIKSGFQWDLVIMNSLIDVYAKCDSLSDAERAFYECNGRNIFTWTSMIVGYVHLGYGKQAVRFFKEMMCSDVRPGSATFSGILPVFSDIGCLELAKQVHGLAMVNACDYDKFFGNALIDMYVNCGGLGYGRLIFDRVKRRDVVCWNTMIKGYVQVELFDEAIELFKLMLLDGISPNRVTLGCIIPKYLERRNGVLHLICELVKMGLSPSVIFSSLSDIHEHVEDIKQVKELDAYISRGGYKSDKSAAVSLIRMYSKFADVEAARGIFDSIYVKELDCWNGMIECYANNKYINKALELFDTMPAAGVKPDLVSWSTIIAGFIDDGDCESAMQMFGDMIWINNIKDLSGIDIVLPLIQSNTCSMTGKALHCMFLRYECEMRRTVRTAFINMYGKCGDVAYAVNLFNSMESKDVVSWNAIISSLARNGCLNEAARTFHEMKKAGMTGNIITWTTIISGFARSGLVDESLKHFRKMQMEGLRPNSITIASILPACAQSATLSHGKPIHCYIIRNGLDCEDLVVSNALLDMFVKCGCMDYAELVFRRLPERDVISWNTMIQGFAIFGSAQASLALFNQMITEGFVPNGITFIGVLNACSHAGLVSEGWRQFNSMESKYGIIPSGKHYACMVDILGRGGHFEDVRDFIVQMPLQPTASLWGALLSACKTHGNMEMAEYAANRLIELQPENPGNYVVLSNIYATTRRWDDVDRTRKMMFSHGIKKSPGGSWIEIGSRVHAFAVENLGKQEMDEINKTLLDITSVMIEEGYVPDLNTDNFEEMAES